MPVAASAIYFLNLRGDVLIKRLYRDDVGGNMVDAFRLHIMQTKELGTCPVRQIGRCSFLYMRISDVYIVTVVSSNANVACAFKFVVEAVNLFKSYFGGQFNEDAIRNNFVLIYELLDEIMDFGYPQNLAPEILKLYITQEGVRSPFSSKIADKPVPNATLQVTGAVGWRREDLVYKKNEVKSVFGAKMLALGVIIKIPVPKQTAKTNMQVTSGKAKYNPSIDCLVWRMKKFPGQTESTLSAELGLISTMAEKAAWTRPPIHMEFQVNHSPPWTRPPIHMEFQVPMFTASGLRVRFLKVWEKSGYNTVEWVRYITKAGSYEIRC
ncbi:hypothetical protein Cgig2_031816 [Carnegiea gigantea]|uniref:MHD domain-containing protein n=1 Tax=Carnegiea gigantea TaxID=171969 RepID=A0A9Q1QMV9_9CARY|nr:hypothetical protein Cgig2_031816 [Carnegiea gigantea]